MAGSRSCSPTSCPRPPDACWAGVGRVNAASYGLRSILRLERLSNEGPLGREPSAGPASLSDANETLSLDRGEGRSVPRDLGKKLKHRVVEDLRRLQGHEVARVRHDQEPRVGDDLLGRLEAGRGRDLIFRADDQQRGHANVAQRGLAVEGDQAIQRAAVCASTAGARPASGRMVG